MAGLSIRSLLTALFGLMTIIIGGQGLLAIHKVAAVNDNTVALARQWLPEIAVVREMNVLAARIRISEARHMNSGSSSDMDGIEGDIRRYEAQIAAARKTFETLITSDAERRTYEDLGKNWNAYRVKHDELIRLSRTGKKDEAVALFRGNLQTAFRALNDNVGVLVANSEERAEHAAATAAGSYAAARLWTLVTMAVGVVVAIGAMVFSFFGVANPITRITHAMGVLAGGNTDIAIPFAGRKDEVGAMAKAVEVFKSNAIQRRRLRSEERRVGKECTG
jgi:methyl-accepting chemotaxis protein